MNELSPVITVDGVDVVVDIYRGSSNTGTDGVTWWSTSINTAKIYSHHANGGYIMHRRIRLPIIEGYIAAPNDYLVGYKNNMPEIDAEYMYGINMECTPDTLFHFDISISKGMLDYLSTEVAVYETPPSKVRVGRSIIRSTK